MLGFPLQQQPKTPLEQHFLNLRNAELQGGLTKPQRSEIRGERGAAKHMSGDQHPFLCHCKETDIVKLEANRDPEDLVGNRCSLCDYDAPYPGEWKMVKGWEGGGTGTDQIWIKPPEWNWLNPDHPPIEEIRIVEAKGGNANLDVGGTYAGQYGPDGTMIGDEGVLQMSDEWVYCTCSLAATSSTCTSEHKAVASLVCDFLTGKQDGFKVTGVVIRDGKPLRDDELPKQHFDLVDSDGLFEYEPVDDRDETFREELANLIWALGPGSKEVTELCGEVVTKIKESEFDKERVKDYKAAIQIGANIFKQKQPQSVTEAILHDHVMNVLAQYHRLVDTLPDLEQRYFDEIFPNKGGALATPERLERAQKAAKKKALTQLYKNLNEVSGEIQAASYMASKGCQMVKGWSGGDTGIDQIWVQSDSQPGFDVTKTWPDDVKIIAVEAKGGSAKLATGQVYKGVTLSDGTVMGNGCKQMSKNWVLHHADDLTTLSQVAPGSFFVGKMIQEGMKNGKPPVFGIGLKGGKPMVSSDFSHLGDTKVKGGIKGFDNVQLLKYS